MPEIEDNNLGKLFENPIVLTQLESKDVNVLSELPVSDQNPNNDEISHIERLTLALDAAKVGWWDLDVATDKVIWNTHHEQIFGYEPGTPERDYFDWERRVHSDDLERIHQATHYARDYRKGLEIQYRIIWPDGSLHWINASGRFYYDKYEKPIRMLGVVTDITHLKQNEEKLWHSRESNRRIMDSTDDCIKILDLDGRLLYINNPGQRLMEVENLASCKGADWVSSWGQANQSEALKALEIAKQGGVAKFEGFCPTSKGTFKWWEVVVTPILNAEGASEQLLVISRDATERWKSEKTLRESEEKFRVTFEQAAVGVAHVDLDGRWLRVNQTLCNIVGYAREELINRTFQDITYVEDLDTDLSYVQQLLAGDIETYSLEKRYICKNGQITWVNLTVALVREPDNVPHPLNGKTTFSGSSLGTPKYFISIIEDINDRKQTEQQLKESEERLRLGVQVAGVALAKFDYSSEQVLLSPEAAILYGFSTEQLVISREQIHAAFHPEDRTELFELIEDAVDPNGKGWFAHDHRVVWPNGEVRWLSVRQQVFFEYSGIPRPSYAILAAIDITNHKVTEAALKERNQELDRFVHIVSHDLKAPLRGIANLTEWIQEDLSGQIPAENEEQLTLMRSRVNRMDAMINGLLEYSKVDRAGLAVEVIDVHTLITEVLDFIVIPPAFSIEIKAEVDSIRARHLLLNQVLLNLISNALNHHHRREGNIEIGVCDLGNYYKFWVQDDGPGISVEHHERIFEIFQTLQSSSTSTGIGLSIVKKIIEAEGGTLELKSEVNVGSKFSFTWLKETSSKNV